MRLIDRAQLVGTTSLVTSARSGSGEAIAVEPTGLDSDPMLDDAKVSDRFAARVLRAVGLNAAEAQVICRRPLPDLPCFG